MKKALGLVILLGLAATPALAQKVTIDYAHDFDFASVKTFQYVDTKESNSQNPMMADRIETLIKKELTEGGLKEVTENPDIQVLRDYIRGDEITLDGVKGYPLNFRPWNNQLRQPVFLTTGNWVVAQAPLEGFLHQSNNLDTLGFDQRENRCKP